MDDYTALHRHLGWPRGPVNDDLLDAAVAAHLEETDDLDWKKPPQDDESRKKFLRESFPRDVAAFANAGGGTLVIGVDEQDSAATDRVDAGEWSDADIRNLRIIAASHVHPPITRLRIYRLQETSKGAVIVVVPPSLDRPHFVQDKQWFAARLRIGSASTWMSEREIAERYRQRFVEQRNATEALDLLYDGAQSGDGIGFRAWAYAAARPRLPIAGPAGFDAEEVRDMVNAAKTASQSMMRGSRWQPLQAVDSTRVRPGLRRWMVRSRKAKVEAWMSIHQDGAVTVSAGLGESATANGETVRYVDSWRLESLVANIVTLAAQASARVGSTEYEVRIGLRWHDSHRLKMLAVDEYFDSIDFQEVPFLDRYDPVEATVALDTGRDDMCSQTRAIALDCVNQGGVEGLVALR